MIAKSTANARFVILIGVASIFIIIFLFFLIVRAGDFERSHNEFLQYCNKTENCKNFMIDCSKTTDTITCKKRYLDTVIKLQ